MHAFLAELQCQQMIGTRALMKTGLPISIRTPQVAGADRRCEGSQKGLHQGHAHCAQSRFALGRHGGCAATGSTTATRRLTHGTCTGSRPARASRAASAGYAFGASPRCMISSCSLRHHTSTACCCSLHPQVVSEPYAYRGVAPGACICRPVGGPRCMRGCGSDARVCAQSGACAGPQACSRMGCSWQVRVCARHTCAWMSAPRCAAMHLNKSVEDPTSCSAGFL